MQNIVMDRGYVGTCDGDMYKRRVREEKKKILKILDKDGREKG